jgi:hypothetical protein
MPENWIDLIAGRNEVLAVQVEIPDDNAPVVIQEDFAWPLQWPLQKGERPAAYRVLHEQVANYCREHRIANSQQA